MSNAAAAEWRDRDLERAIWLGVAIGVPLMFAVTVALSALADIAIWKAFGIAAMPAAFVGPYIGGLFAMGAEASRHERAEQAPVIVEDAEADERLAA